MNFISKDHLVKRFGDKPTIQLSDLVGFIEEEFECKVSVSKKWSEEQRLRVAKKFFFDEDVLKQLHASDTEPEDTDIVDYDQFKEFMRSLKK